MRKKKTYLQKLVLQQKTTLDDEKQISLNSIGLKEACIESDKNIAIDEEGFSRYDLADLAGIAPELTLGIAVALFLVKPLYQFL